MSSKDLESKNFIEKGFRTFKKGEGYSVVSRIEIRRDDDYLGTGNYFVEIFGKEENLNDGFDEYIIDTDEFTNMEGVRNYLTYMGRNYDEMMQILKENYEK
tara:strand:+ start:1333 stop:1635 length:303 start_codon:yes stop_codon:yes gene_type:complete